MWSSLKLRSSDEPRWPEVPKATALGRLGRVGMEVKYAETSRGTLTSMSRGAGLPARGWMGTGIFLKSKDSS